MHVVYAAESMCSKFRTFKLGQGDSPLFFKISCHLSQVVTPYTPCIRALEVRESFCPSLFQVCFLSASHVGWISWFSTLVREAFLRGYSSFPFHKNQHNLRLCDKKCLSSIHKLVAKNRAKLWKTITLNISQKPQFAICFYRHKF